MHPVEVETALESLQIIVDTREHPGKRFLARMKQAGVPYVREKLDFGDYSAKVIMNGVEISIEDSVVIERKMNGNELAMCFTRERDRFKAEFDRAKEAGAKVYLLLENENVEKLYRGAYGDDPTYRSQMNANSFMGSFYAFIAEYGIIPVLCREETSGKVIRDILYYEMREKLKNG